MQQSQQSMLGLVAYNDSDDEEADQKSDSEGGEEQSTSILGGLVGGSEEEDDEPKQVTLPGGGPQMVVQKSLFGSLPIPMTKEKEMAEERRKQKEKKKKKKEKKKKKKEKEEQEKKAVEEEKKKNPHGVLMRKISINVAPTLGSGTSKIDEALATAPTVVQPATELAVSAQQEESKPQIVVLDQRRRGYAASGRAALGSFSIQPDEPPEEQPDIYHKIAPTAYANATTAGRPTLAGKYYTRQMPDKAAPVVPGKVAPFFVLVAVCVPALSTSAFLTFALQLSSS